MESSEHPIIQAYRSGNKFGDLLGMDFVIKSSGEVHYSVVVTESHLATPVAAHGGLLAALADATLGVGALSVSAENGNVVSTVEFKISYLSPALLGKRVIGMSRSLKNGKSLIFMDGTIVCEEGKLLATMQGTFNQYPVDKLVDFFK